MMDWCETCGRPEEVTSVSQEGVEPHTWLVYWLECGHGVAVPKAVA